MVMEAPSFPLVEVYGRPRERGRQHGEACREQVRTYADTLLRVLGGEAQLRSLDAGCADGDARVSAGAPAGASSRPGLTREALYARALTFLPAFEAFAPHLVDEIRGIAEGAGVPFEAALLVNVRAEVAGVVDSGCTAFAVGREATASGNVLLGQNQDQSPEMEALGVVLRVRPDDGPPVVMATFGGLVGYPGVNGAGVAHFQNALSNGVWRHALPHYPMKRVLFEQRDVAGCLAVFDRARLASCGNYVIGDGTGRLVDVEATPDGYALLEPEEGIVAHTNHFRSDRFRPQERLLGSLPDSAARLGRMQTLLRREHGRITLETVKRALRDHDGEPAAICRHEPGRPMKSIASIIAEPDAGRLHVARGNPCESEYVAYAVA
ncbi:MAG: C45 family autoproteolytic acyltransferase/hydrolase [Chloroflexota bacterium]